MFSSRSVQIAAVFSDVFGQALPNLCRSFYNETKAEMFFSVFAVALLAEGVDRNSCEETVRWQRSVALLAEGVDRNPATDAVMDNAYQSPSSRRAWIEILGCGLRLNIGSVALLAEGVDRNFRRIDFSSCVKKVALLAEGVDRNAFSLYATSPFTPSPSSRRAWIEILC